MRPRVQSHLLFTAFVCGFLALNAAATTYYVDVNSPGPTPPYTNWATASTDIQSAVNQTTNGDLVLVNPGVYQSGGYKAPDGMLSAVVVTNAVTLQSVSGATVTSINGSNAMRCIYLASGAGLGGFTLTNGNAGNGGGVYCASTNATVSNCLLVSNTATGAGNGGGSYCGTFNNCTFYENNANPVASDPNEFGQGGGAYGSVLNQCIISKNGAGTGGAVYSCALYNCTIFNNAANYCAGAAFCTLANCLIISNSAFGYGGGSEGGTLINCTVVDNTDSGFAAGAINATLENCIIYSNDVLSSGVNDSGCTFNYSCAPDAAGVGCITNAPLFVNPTGGGFQLQSNSPCIDAGNDAYVTSPTDLSGGPRIIGASVDMGAYEYQPSNYIGIEIQPVSQTVINGQNAAFNVTTVSPDPLNYQWLFNGTNITGATNSVYSLSNVQSNNDGFYSVVISNAFVTVISSNAILTAMYPVQIIVQPTNEASLSGGNTSFTVMATGTALNYQWYFNGMPLTNGGSVTGSMTPTLTITNVQTNNNGSYTILVTNLFFSATSSNGILTVYNPAQIVTQPADTGVLLSNNISLTVTATGTALGYQWFFNGAPLTDDGQIVGSTTPILYISNFQNNDVGAYTVAVTNLLSATNSLPAVLTLASIRYVNVSSAAPVSPYTTWATAAVDIQSAINVSTNGDLVMVTNGVYQTGGETVNGFNLTNRVVINDAITVQSVNGPAATIIEGNPTIGSNAVRCVYMTNGAALYGFTLTDGATLSTGDEFQEQSGGGLFCWSTSVVVSNCVIIGNFAQGEVPASGIYGGGGGGAYNGTLFDCQIVSNSAVNGEGGGAYQGSFSNCTFIANTSPYFGGAVFEASADECTLTNNSAGNNGGGAYISSLTNCLIIDNSAGFGAGVSSSTVNNCTIIYNNAEDYGGGVDNQCTPYNSIIYYNTAGAGYNVNYVAGMLLNYCCTTPVPTNGVNNITNNPQFVNLTGDFNLQSNSPCINEGNNAYVAETSDLDGNPRIVCGTVDMGAYEYQASIPMTLVINANITNVATGFPMQLQAVVGQGYASSILWNFGDGTTATNQLALSHSWIAPGIYTVTVTVSNNFVPEATSANLTVNISSQLDCYVDANGSNPMPPYSSWETAATNIQDAVDAAQVGGLVMATNGLYQYGGKTVNGFGLTNRVAINSFIVVESVNGPSSTIIKGYQVPGTINSNSAIRCVYLGTNAMLIGFTIADGATLSSGDPTNEESGGGIFCPSVNGPTISNCVITANASGNMGGGVYQGTLIDCTILGNQATKFGGGVANAQVFQSLIISNNANGLNNQLTSTGEGGGAYNSTIYNSAIADNSAEYEGGGTYGGAIVNCTVTFNTATNGAGGGTAGVAQTNSIIYYNAIFSNQPSFTNCYTGGSFQSWYCCTYPRPLGRGLNNITNDPELASISHISFNSPCKYAGTSAASIGTDIDGNPWNSPPSIGCSEIPAGGDFGNFAVNISAQLTNQAPGYPVNFQASISGPIYNTVWNFGDGTIVTNAPNLFHIWSSVGAYPVTLTAYNDSYPTGVTATIMINIAVPTTYYVCLQNPHPTPPYAYWSTAATNIQDAVSVAPAGSLILVTNAITITNFQFGVPSNGIAIYQYGGGRAPNGLFYHVILTNAVTLQSVNGPSKTYIEGAGSGTAYGGVYMTNGAVLNGFTVTNVITYTGIYATSTNTVITNCAIAGCSAGGVYSGTLYNCSLYQNSTASKASTMNYCLISNNSAQYGAGAYGGVLNNCIIVSNSASSDGGGAYATQGYPLTLNNCIVSNNTAQYGGGVYNGNVSSGFFTNCILTNCILTQNSANQQGGGAVEAQLNNCIISNNQVFGFAAYGGGVEGGLLNNCMLVGNFATNQFGDGAGADGTFYNNTYGTVLNNCILVSNVVPRGYGGGANACILNNCTLLWNTCGNSGGGAEDSVLTGSLIISNFAGYGGGADSGILTNCILADNVASAQGGGANQSSLVNCTVISNLASTGGGGVINCQVDNCILYYNTGGDYTPNTSHYPIYYSCTAILPTNGFRNITAPPLFVNQAAGNYHLKSTSPCINSGNNAYITAATDFDGNPRIVGGTVDIGAYEYQTPTSIISYAWLQQYGLPIDGSVDFADLDGTAFSVYQDWVAGLNPTNPASVLAMQTPVSTNSTTGVVVSWQSVSGVPYLLQRSTNLMAQPPFTTIQNNIVGQAGTTSYKDTSATNPGPYIYRVGVSAP